MNIQHKNLFLSLLFILFSSLTMAQKPGSITGKVVDAKTGEELIGVTVIIEGTTQGAATDYEGKFRIGNVKPGTYTLIFSYVSYVKFSMKNVEVKSADFTNVTAALKSETKELVELVIQGEARKESASALLIQQKNSVTVSSGVSADLIRKTPDRTTADVIKRISGASVQDNKFAIIRGLSDRYNMGYLNGAPLPSTESDRKAFSLDIIPASVIDNMAIVKSATPDLPGDFAGGIIQINTKDIPSENTVTFNVAGQYHSLTTFKSGISGNRSSTDWLGFDGGTRQLPSNLMSTSYAREKATAQENATQTMIFNNNFLPKNISSFRPNLSLQFSASRRMQLFKNDFGVIFALSYNNSFKSTPFTTANVPVSGLSSVNTDNADGFYSSYNNYRNTVTGGAVLNFAYKVGKNNKFTFKNMLSSNSEDQTINQTGTFYDNNRQDIRKYNNYTYYYQSSRLLSSQLSGEHYITNSKLKIKYTGSINSIHREVPDYRRILYQSNFVKSAGDTSQSPYLVAASGSNSFTPQNSGRYFSALDEQMYSAGYDFSFPVKLKYITKAELKFGGLNIWRDRTFSGRNFLYASDDNIKDPARTDIIDKLSADKVFANQNIDATTHFLKETTQGTDSYKGLSRLNAAYVMADFKVIKKLRIIGGARVEQFRQKLSWTDALSSKPAEVDTTYVDLLPSVNLVYELTEKTNLRASASKTLSRPEFREFAPMAFYEINYNAIIRGNPALVKAQIYNYDFKFEYFPTAGQTFSINPFYKKFINPVESKNEGGTAGINNFSYINAPSAVNYGVEFEAKANFASLITAAKENWISKFSVFGNLALIQSNVTLSGNGGNTGNSVNSRPLQGQSPYVFNAGILYSDIKAKTDINLTVNRIGRRLAYVNDAKEFLIWENPRTVVDMSISKTFEKRIQIKLTFGDLLAQNLVFYQDLNGNKKYDKNSDVSTFNYTFGRTVQVYFGYTF